MDELEARIRCLELAAQINKATGDHSSEGIVKIASLLYTFCQASPPVETPEVADKPKRGRLPKAADILS